MVFITGGTGFLGAHLIHHLLLKGDHIIALKRPTSKFDLFNRVFAFYNDDAKSLSGKLEWLEGDLLDPGSLDEAISNNITEIYHAAAIVSFQPKDKAEMMHTNIVGTANLVNASLNKNVRKLCHVSSIAAIGRSENHQIIDEDVLWKSSKRNSNYAVSKYGAEREVWRGIEEGLPAVIINPAVILGPGEINSGTGKMISIVLKGLRFYSRGSNGFVDVRDVVSIIDQLAKSIISAENLSYKELFRMIAESTGKTPPRLKAGNLMSQVAWRLSYVYGKLTRTKPLITRETAITAGNDYLYSNRKISEVLNYRFIPVKKAIEDSCRYYMKSC
jgi:nucleoside-diphosphate-sugar epimerase